MHFLNGHSRRTTRREKCNRVDGSRRELTQALAYFTSSPHIESPNAETDTNAYKRTFVLKNAGATVVEGPQRLPADPIRKETTVLPFC